MTGKTKERRKTPVDREYSYEEYLKRFSPECRDADDADTDDPQEVGRAIAQEALEALDRNLSRK